MPGQRVEISYEAAVRGIDRIEELIRRNAELQGQTETYKKRLSELTEQEKRHDSTLRSVGKSIQSFRKELFAISFTIGAVIGGLKLLAGSSDQLAAKLEKVNDAWRNMANAIGGAISKSIDFFNRTSSGAGFLQGGFFGAGAGVKSNLKPANDDNRTRAFRSAEAAVESQIAALQGDTVTALQKRQYIERLQLQDKYRGEDLRKMESFYAKKHALEMEDLRMTEIGIKKQIDIQKDFRRDVVSGFRGGISSTLFNALQGEKQSGADVLKNFATGFNRAIAEAVSQAITTSLANGSSFFTNIKNVFSGRTQSVIAQEKTTDAVKESQKTLLAIMRCVCETAANTASMASRGAPTLSYDPGKDTMKGVRMAAGITGIVAAVAGAGAALGSMGGGSSVGYNNPSGSNAGISMGPGAFATGRYGGWVNRLPRYQTGGEVPAILHSGEFVVNAKAAQTNKEMLKDLNAGNAVKGSGGNVFLIKTNDAESFADMLSSPSSRNKIEVAVIRAIMQNGDIRRIIKDFAK